jgi:hypothetical protein
MAFENDNAPYTLPPPTLVALAGEGDSSAAPAGGFAPGFALPKNIAHWNAPRNAQKSPANSNKDDSEALAKKMIDTSLSQILQALANPSLTEEQRASLMAQQSQLEGLRAQMSLGASGVNVQQILSTALAASATVASTVASVGMGGDARVIDMQISSSQRMIDLQNRLYENDPIYRAQTDALMKDADVARKAFGETGSKINSLSQELGLDTAESDRKRAEIDKKRQEAKKNGDVIGELKGDVADTTVNDEDAQKALEKARKIGDPEKIRKAEELARIAAEEKRAAEERLREQQKNVEASIQNNPNLTPEQKEAKIRHLQQDSALQRSETNSFSNSDIQWAASFKQLRAYKADMAVLNENSSTADPEKRATEERLVEAQKLIESARSSNDQEKIRLAEENLKKATEEKRAAEERLAEKQKTMEAAITNNPNFTPQQKEIQLALARNNIPHGETIIHNSTNEVVAKTNITLTNNTVASLDEKIKDKVSENALMSMDRDAPSTSSTTAASPKASVTQLASNTEVKEAAKAVTAANVSAAGDASHENKAAPIKLADASAVTPPTGVSRV